MVRFLCVTPPSWSRRWVIGHQVFNGFNFFFFCSLFPSSKSFLFHSNLRGKKRWEKVSFLKKKNIKIKEERLRCRQRWTMTLIWRGFNELLHAKDLFTEMDETNAVLRPLTRPFLHSFLFHSFFSWIFKHFPPFLTLKVGERGPALKHHNFVVY